MTKLTLPKSKRLVSNRQIREVLDRGCRAGDRLLTLRALENKCGYPRLGVSVGRSCGDAVVRNRVKRLMREAFRLSQDRIPRPFDYVLMLAPAVARKLKAVHGAARASGLLTRADVQRSFLALARTACKDLLAGEQVTDSDLS